MKFFLSKNTPAEESRVGLSRPTGRKVVGKVWRTDAGKAEALIELNRNDVRPDGFPLKTTRKFLVFSSTTFSLFSSLPLQYHQPLLHENLDPGGGSDEYRLSFRWELAEHFRMHSRTKK